MAPTEVCREADVIDLAVNELGSPLSEAKLVYLVPFLREEQNQKMEKT